MNFTAQIKKEIYEIINQALEDKMYDIADDPMFNEKIHDNLYANLEDDEIFEYLVEEIISCSWKEEMKSLYISRGWNQN